MPNSNRNNVVVSLIGVVFVLFLFGVFSFETGGLILMVIVPFYDREAQKLKVKRMQAKDGR